MKYTGWRKYLVAAWALVETFLFGGLLYGWVPVVWIFKQQNIYSNLCSANHTAQTSNLSISYEVLGGRNVTSQEISDSYDETCNPQDKKFALVFTIGSGLFCASSALTGYVNYKLGTRVTRILSMIVFISGTLMFAFVSVDVPWLIFPGLTCIGVGGLPLLMTNAQISSLFITGSSTFIGLLIGANGSSSAVQLLVKIAYEKGIHSSHSYYFLTALHSMVAISTFIFLPKDFILPGQTKIQETEITLNENSTELLERKGGTFEHSCVRRIMVFRAGVWLLYIRLTAKVMCRREKLRRRNQVRKMEKKEYEEAERVNFDPNNAMDGHCRDLLSTQRVVPLNTRPQFNAPCERRADLRLISHRLTV